MLSLSQAFNPGLVLTKMATKFDDNRELLTKSLEAGYLMGRLGQPEDIAHMAAFLMSDKASWIIFPDKVAFAAEREEITFRDLQSKARRIATHLA